jgi:ATP phosphoribosyltransferase
LTIALPKGRIRDPVLKRLGDWAPDLSLLESRKLKVAGPKSLPGGAELLYALVKDPDIPAYVEHGAADVGIVGLDVLEERPADIFRPLITDLGQCRMCLCGKPGTDPEALAASGSLRIATKYPSTALHAMDQRGLAAEIIPLQGSVELSIVSGLADAIVDLVETGETLRANGLVVLQDILVSTARAIVNRASWRLRTGDVREVLERLQNAPAKIV